MIYSERSQQIIHFLKDLQKNICATLEEVDGKARFLNDEWNRPEGGGGLTRVIQNGNVYEKGGVNFSAVHGEIPAFLQREITENFPERGTAKNFFATGVSIVIHPQSPMVPIIHMNIRYFETDNGVYWFGGGIDLTPHYVVEEDAKYFHQKLKAVCDTTHPEFYDRFRKWCDDYFFIKHRNETRGVGGIFFDKLKEDNLLSFDDLLKFWKAVGETFAPAYAYLSHKNKDKAFTEKHKNWQLLRRGRYVEFNLIYDKGTKFGLETNGRVESILMSLPKTAGWEYNFIPENDSEEQKTLSLLKKGLNWV